MASRDGYRYDGPQDKTESHDISRGDDYTPYNGTGAPEIQGYHEKDVFGLEGDHAIKYKTLSWWMVAGMFSIISLDDRSC